MSMRTEHVWVLGFVFALGCESGGDDEPLDVGGASNTGGASSNTGGTMQGTTGGSPNTTGGMAPSGGTPTTGTGGAATGGGATGSGAMGGTANGGTAKGGTAMGGSSVAGANNNGGKATTGGRGGGGRSTGGAGGKSGTASGGSATASGGSATATGGSGGACTQNIACKLTAAASTGDIYQDCVDRINQFRTQCACLPPLARWTDGEACANQMAEYDSTATSAHAGFQARICSGGSAQDECPGWGSNAQVVSGCLQSMWDEGPPPTSSCTGTCFNEHGHFINMSSTSYTKVACGFFTTPAGKVWAVQNFSR